MTAAVAAAAEGMRVALLEPGRHVGGMVSGGLGWTDLGHHEVIGGLALEFYTRVGKAYGVPAFGVTGPEPHVAERVFREWLEEAGVVVRFGHRLERVHKRGHHIEVVTAAGTEYGAHTFIDASYEGDVAAGAGVSCAVGREGTGKYGESWAGRQPWRPSKHNFDVTVSPFRDDRTRDLLPLILDRPLAAIGEGDGAVQAYGFRLCLTRDPDNRLPFSEPPDYKSSHYELLRRYLEVKGDTLHAHQLLGLTPNLPNGKCDANSLGPISTNLLDGSNWAYPDADAAARSAIWKRHLHYTQGFMYFLTHDPSVPTHIRSELGSWGLCRDEFVDTGGWPHQLYVREARRIVGEYVLTQHDLGSRRVKYDSVGMGSYHIDVREVQRSWDYVHAHPYLLPAVFNEGYISVPVEPYELPYRALLPQFYECANLLVPVCMSASHVAFASVRMEPQFMILGHSVGVAAGIAVRENLPVQRVGIAGLRRRLIEQGQVLSLA